MGTNKPPMDWWIDGKIDLTQVCRNSGWQEKAVTEALIRSGLSFADAKAFTYFILNDTAWEEADGDWASHPYLSRLTYDRRREESQ